MFDGATKPGTYSSLIKESSLDRKLDKWVCSIPVRPRIWFVMGFRRKYRYTLLHFSLQNAMSITKTGIKNKWLCCWRCVRFGIYVYSCSCCYCWVWLEKYPRTHSTVQVRISLHYKLFCCVQAYRFVKSEVFSPLSSRLRFRLAKFECLSPHIIHQRLNEFNATRLFNTLRLVDSGLG